MTDTFSITNGTRSSLPRVPFSRIKEAVLGKKYTLSLVFIGDTRMRQLNKESRGKDATTDILSFPLSETSGEILISATEAAKRSKNFSLSPTHYSTYIFIHGLLHLRGYEHGSDMEKQEDRFAKQFGITLPPALHQ